MITPRIWISIIIVSALFVGLISVAPQVLIWKNISQENGGMIFLSPNLENASDVTQAYLPRAREVYDGHFPPGELSLEPGGPYLLPPLPPLVAAFFIGLFGGNIPAAYLGLVFFFSALVFVAFYLAGWIFLRHRLWSLFLAAVGVLTPLALINTQLFTGWEEFSSILLKQFVPIVQTPLAVLSFGRIDDPLLTYVFYLAAIAALFLFWQKPTLGRALSAGVLLGLLAYVYFHYWVYLTVVVAILFIYSLAKVRSYPQRFKMFLVLGASLAVMLIPYFINYFAFQNTASAGDYLARIWLEYGRAFRASRLPDYLTYLVLAAIVWRVFWRRDRERAVFFLGLIAAMFVVWNIQVFTGYTPHPYHFWRAISPALFLIGFNIIFVLAQKYNQRKLAALLIVLTVLLGAKKVVNAFEFIKPTQEVIAEHSLPTDIVSSWQWMDRNLTKEPRVISSSFITSFYLYSYASARPYLPTGLNTFVPTAEIEHRFLVANKLFGVPAETVEKRLRRQGVRSAEAADQIYSNTFRLNFFDVEHLDNRRPELKHWAVPEEKISELMSEYRELKLSWGDIPADYVYVGPWERELDPADFSRNPQLEPIFTNPSVEIYKIIKD